MNPSISIAAVRKSVVVPVKPARAFEIFTSGIDSWWPKSHSMGGAPFKVSLIEPFNGGRWYAKRDDGSEINIGHVLVWEPGRRVVFRWEISAEWKPDGDNPSELEVTFIAESPEATRVELEHRDFERLGEKAGEKLRSDVDRGWPMALDMYAEEVARQSA